MSYSISFLAYAILLGLTDSCILDAGSSEVMVGLHDGIVGMRPWDKRKITIPTSMRLGIK
jgi:hypothetical protein